MLIAQRDGALEVRLDARSSVQKSVAKVHGVREVRVQLQTSLDDRQTSMLIDSIKNLPKKKKKKMILNLNLNLRKSKLFLHHKVFEERSNSLGEAEALSQSRFELAAINRA